MHLLAALPCSCIGHIRVYQYSSAWRRRAWARASSSSTENVLSEFTIICIADVVDELLLLDPKSLGGLPVLALVLGMAGGVQRCQTAVPPPKPSVRMQSTMMTMRAQAPLALSARPARSTQRVARPMSISTQLGQMAQVSGTPLQTITAARMPTGIRRRHRLLVEAAKKSVGDLQKSDLEGKNVLVRLYMPFNAFNLVTGFPIVLFVTACSYCAVYTFAFSSYHAPYLVQLEYSGIFSASA